MEVSQEKLAELADCLKKMRVFRNDDRKLYIKEDALGAYEKLSENIEIVRENFKYFSKRPNSFMYPDEFIKAIKFLPNGNQILADNLEYILESITHNAGRARSELIGIPEVSEKVADDFENTFNLLIYGGTPKEEREHSIKPEMKYTSCCPGITQENLAIFMCLISGSEKANEVLEENKELFLNSDFNSAMSNITRILGRNPNCHEFIRNNFDTIKQNCYVPELAELYCNIREICPEEFEKAAFIIDKIYMPAKSKNDYSYNSNQIDKICSRLIEQDRAQDVEKLAEFLSEQATIEPGAIKFLGCGWYNMAIQAGDKVIKLGVPDGEEEKPKIPYHPRLLQPIVRKNDMSKDKNHPIGIEIYEVVDMDTEISDEEILEVYKELREAGIKWTDIKRDNLGRLRKDNYPHEIGQNVPVPPEFLGIEDSGVERKILKAGELVIIDLDCLEMAKDKRGCDFTKMAVVPDCVRQYEREYQERIKGKTLAKKPEMPEEH